MQVRGQILSTLVHKIQKHNIPITNKKKNKMPTIPNLLLSLVLLTVIDSSRSSAYIPWYHHTNTSMVTISPSHNADIHSFEDILDYATKMKEGSFTVLALDAIYDSGVSPPSSQAESSYEDSRLWYGLALSDITQPNQYLSTDDNVQKLADLLHSQDMKLMSWINPSYMWTGASYFKQAEQDLITANSNLNAIDPESPARAFLWIDPQTDARCQVCNASTTSTTANHSCSRVKPSDANPTDKYTAQNEAEQWIYNPAVHLCYWSFFSDQPTGDWNSSVWQNYIVDGVKRYIDLGLDGIVLDAPNCYLTSTNSGDVEVGATSTVKSFIVDPLKAYASMGLSKRAYNNNEFPIFGEVYDDIDFTVEANLDGSYTSVEGEVDVQADFIFDGVLNADPSLIETGFAEADSMLARCYYTDFQHCPVSLNRMRLFPVINEASIYDDEYNYSKLNRMIFYLTALGGYQPVIEYVMEDPTEVSVDYDNDFWRDEPLYGISFSSSSVDSIPSMMLASMALTNRMSLRIPLLVNDNDDNTLFAMMKYDAFSTGNAAIVTAHLSPSSDVSITEIIFDKTQFSVLNEMTYNDMTFGVDTSVGFNLTEDQIMLNNFGVDTSAFNLTELLQIELNNLPIVVQQLKENSLPVWNEVSADNNDSGDSNSRGLDCWPSSLDATGITDDNDRQLFDSRDGNARMLLGTCFLECLSESRYACDSVSIQWLEAGYVECWGLPKNTLDPTMSCTNDSAWSTFRSSNEKQNESVGNSRGLLRGAGN